MTAITGTGKIFLGTLNEIGTTSVISEEIAQVIHT
jgi:hypothetical protein